MRCEWCTVLYGNMYCVIAVQHLLPHLLVLTIGWDDVIKLVFVLLIYR